MSVKTYIPLERGTFTCNGKIYDDLLSILNDRIQNQRATHTVCKTISLLNQITAKITRFDCSSTEKRYLLQLVTTCY